MSKTYTCGLLLPGGIKTSPQINESSP